MAVAEHGRAIMKIESCSHCSPTVTHRNYSPSCLFRDGKAWEIIALPLASLPAHWDLYVTIFLLWMYIRWVNKRAWNGRTVERSFQLSVILSVYACPRVTFAKLVIQARYKVSTDTKASLGKLENQGGYKRIILKYVFYNLKSKVKVGHDIKR